MKAIISIASCCLLLTAYGGAEAKEILLHQGMDIVTPGLGPKEEITFRKEFYVDEALLKKQPPFHDPLSQPSPLPPEKAIALAKASIDTGDGPGNKNLVRLELLARGGLAPKGHGRTHFYLIEFIADGSQIHRIVLMDGTVVESRLREIKAQ